MKMCYLAIFAHHSLLDSWSDSVIATHQVEGGHDSWSSWCDRPSFFYFLFLFFKSHLHTWPTYHTKLFIPYLSLASHLNSSSISLILSSVHTSLDHHNHYIIMADSLENSIRISYTPLSQFVFEGKTLNILIDFHVVC